MPSRLARHLQSRLRRGVTLIELLVALVLFDIALLSLVAVSAVAVRRVGDAGRRTRAAAAAMNRLEWLEIHACASAPTGSLSLERGVTEHWASTGVAGGQEMRDSVGIESRVSESLVIRSRRLCP